MDSSPVVNSLTNNALKVIDSGFQRNSDLIFGILFGLFIAWIYHRTLGLYFLQKTHKNLIEAKDETIHALSLLVEDRLNQIKVEKESDQLFKKIKRNFLKIIKGKT